MDLRMFGQRRKFVLRSRSRVRFCKFSLHTARIVIQMEVSRPVLFISAHFMDSILKLECQVMQKVCIMFTITIGASLTSHSGYQVASVLFTRHISVFVAMCAHPYKAGMFEIRFHEIGAVLVDTSWKFESFACSLPASAELRGHFAVRATLTSRRPATMGRYRLI